MVVRPTLAVACCLVVSGALGSARADELPSPGPGSRARVDSRGLESAPLVGTLTAIDHESLTVAPRNDREHLVVAREDVLRLEWSVRPSRKPLGALIGFGVGAAVVLGKAVHQGGCNDGCDAQHAATAALVALSAAAVGALLSPGEQWEEVDLERVPSRPTKAFRAGPEVRLVPQVGRRIGLTVVASF